jgi:WD40 repeat protein
MPARWSLAIVCTVASLSPCGAQSDKRPEAKLELGPNDKVIARLGNDCGVAGLAYSPDGKLLAFAGGDGVIRLRELAAEKEVRRFEGQTNFIRTVAFSPDGKLLVSAGDDPNVIVWDVASGKESRRVGSHANNLRMAAFSPDGKTIISSGFDDRIGLWDAATGKQLLLFRAHPRVPYAVAFSPDGRTLASGGDREGTIRLWDAASGRPIRSWEGHQQCVYTVAYSPDGRLLATGGGDAAARVWEAATGKEVFKLDGHAGGVSRLVFAADGRTLLTASHDHNAHLWEIVTGREIRRFGRHGRWVWGLAYSPLGQTVATAGDDGTVVVWDLGPTSPKTAAAAKDLTLPELTDAWRNLAGENARKAFDAATRLSASRPEQVVPYLRDRLHPVKPFTDEEKLKRLIAELNHTAFRVREQASRELTQFGETVGAALRNALASDPAPEATRRLEALIANLDARELSPDELQAIRAVRILEDVKTPDSLAVLKQLAAGAPGAKLTVEATAALGRLSTAGK